MAERSPNIPDAGARATGYLIAARVAVVAGVFCAVVIGVLAATYFDRELNDWREAGLLLHGDMTPKSGGPLDTPEYARLKVQSLERPNDEAVKEQIRRLDEELRRRYFRQTEMLHVGSHLLALGLIVLVVASKTATRLRGRMPDPGPAITPVDRESRENRRARWTIAGLAVLLTGVGALLSLATRPSLPTIAAGGKSPTNERAATEKPPVKLGPAPSAQEIAQNWPRFRGPDGSGRSAFEGLPTEWDAASGKGILWKTPVALPGNNSPVVWGDRVFLTGANEKQREVYCFDAATGKPLWTRPIPDTPESKGKTPKVIDDTGYAAPTATTDGRAVFAMFANGDVAAVDFAGTILWTRGLGVPTSVYGHSASLLLDGDRLIVQFDQASAADRKSRLMALDVASGKTVWETPRAVPNSWATPLLIEHALRRQIITTADPWVIAYSPDDGKELWRAKCLSGDQGVSPVFVDGLLQVGNEYVYKWTALKVDGVGDVTKTHAAWTAEDGLPDMVSPVVVGKILLLTTSAGLITAMDATTGETLWEEDVEADVTSSPGVVGKLVYVIAKDGRGFVLEPTPSACRRVAKNNLGEPCVTSPAFAKGRIFLRGEKQLFCIGE